MKKSLTILLSAIFVFSISCSKNEAENVVDCVAESLTVSISATPDPGNPKKIDFKLNYTGSHTIRKVDWTFGDGNKATVNGTTTSHTYAAAAGYTVKAKVEIVNGSAICSPEPLRNITVN